MRHQRRWSSCSGWRLVPRPRLHLIRLHGVLAPNPKLRALVVPQEVPQAPEPPVHEAKPVKCDALRASSPGATELDQAA